MSNEDESIFTKLPTEMLLYLFAILFKMMTLKEFINLKRVNKKFNNAVKYILLNLQNYEVPQDIKRPDNSIIMDLKNLGKTLKLFRKLKRLQIRFCNTTDELFLKMSKCSYIQELHLVCCRGLTPTGYRILSKHLPKIYHLDLSYSNVNDKRYILYK